MKQLAKIGINNLFEAILFTPKSYTNTFLIKKLNTKQINKGTIKVRIIDKKQFKKTLKINALMIDFDENLEMIIFNAKYFHNITFAIGKEIYISGSFEFIESFKSPNNFNPNVWKINQPKVITNINQIILNFPYIKMKSIHLNEIFKKIINYKDLKNLGLSDEIINNILVIFHPEPNNVIHNIYLEEFEKNNGLFGIYLDSIKFVEIFYYIQSLRRKKNIFEAVCKLEGNYLDFIQSLPFSLTKGQKDCIQNLNLKLNSLKATRCVVMGDVGCGKTIVILACVMIAYPKKTILLVPTTILARQLYNESKKFLPKFVKVGIVIKDDEITNCDFLIGTHSLLYKNLDSFSLFMTDEQHRFGTNQRLKIEKMLEVEGKKPHNIQFSATPIPRTMALIESNLVDFCNIYDLPFKKDIDSKIITKSDFNALLEHIKNDILNNQQIAIIYPLVEKSHVINYQSIEEGLPFWQKNFQKVYSTYGKDKQKEEIIEKFRDNGNILIATTLFEVGISLPRLSSIIIVGAERLGFSTLHQLRGRVSRNGLKGYCFLYTNHADSKRLKDFIKTTNGFEIAELDLKYRNSGDLLRGIRQSGNNFKYLDISTDIEIVKNAQKMLNDTGK